MVTTTDKPGSESAAQAIADAASASPIPFPDPIVVKLPPDWQLTDEALAEFAELNDLAFERTVEGDLVITLPPHGRAPRVGARIIAQLLNWVDAGGGGEVADSSGGYRLDEPSEDADPNRLGTLRAPDVSWMSQEQFRGMSEREQVDGYPSLCPRFVVEVISAKQRVEPQQTRMAEWLDFGAQLGWLIDPQAEKVWIYQRGQEEPEELDRPESLSGGETLAGFVLDCDKIWR